MVEEVLVVKVLVLKGGLVVEGGVLVVEGVLLEHYPYPKMFISPHQHWNCSIWSLDLNWENCQYEIVSS